MSDLFDRQHFAAAYRLLAEVFERKRPEGRTEDHLSFILGDLTRRLFVGTHFVPPDEIFEQVAQVLRKGDPQEGKQLAQRLREHASHLEETQS